MKLSKFCISMAMVMAAGSFVASAYAADAKVLKGGGSNITLSPRLIRIPSLRQRPRLPPPLPRSWATRLRWSLMTILP